MEVGLATDTGRTPDEFLQRMVEKNLVEKMCKLRKTLGTLCDDPNEVNEKMRRVE